ncbi:MAG: hypothetical protein GVX96_05665, partial [Bacteroidetes bacterium]|nr:hypothetical protein [Bacteroidota bacterium]
MFFKQIPGNGAVKNQLQQAVHKEKLPHASLLLGAPGRAGLPLVRAIMAYIFCSKPQGSDSCGTCENCQKTHHLTHPDIHFTIPTIGSKSRSADLLQAWREMMQTNPYSSLTDWQNHIEAENKQFNINVLEVKDIIEFAGMKSYQGEEKFLVIWMADLLGQNGNRLLKMIEEPPSGMYIFLLAENRETILNTILSRCRMWVLDPFQDSEVQAYLESEFDTESPAAQSAAFQANGDLNAALKA